MKFIKVSLVAFEMLQELSKKNRKTPDAYMEEVIKTLYQQKK